MFDGYMYLMLWVNWTNVDRIHLKGNKFAEGVKKDKVKGTCNSELNN